jgi:hypothetical protein
MVEADALLSVKNICKQFEFGFCPLSARRATFVDTLTGAKRRATLPCVPSEAITSFMFDRDKGWHLSN